MQDDRYSNACISKMKKVKNSKGVKLKIGIWTL
jgi:hypothetical protein